MYCTVLYERIMLYTILYWILFYLVEDDFLHSLTLYNLRTVLSLVTLRHYGLNGGLFSKGLCFIVHLEIFNALHVLYKFLGYIFPKAEESTK